MTSWLKLSRSLLSWEHFKEPNLLSVFLFLLIKANAKDREFEGVTVHRGQLATSYSTIADACGITRNQAITAIRRLVKSNEVSTYRHGNFLVINLKNYAKYQDAKPKKIKNNVK